MDDSNRDPDRNPARERAPAWLGRPRPPVATRRPLWAQFEAPSEPTSWVLNLALLIVLCVVAMALATAILRQWRPTPVAPEGMVVVPLNAEVAAVRSQATAAEGLEKEARLKAQREGDERRQAAVRQREADEEAALRRAELDARREREWRAYYKKPAYCDELQPTIDSVGCANDYIRARRAFDAQFTATARR